MWFSATDLQSPEALARSPLPGVLQLGSPGGGACLLPGPVPQGRCGADASWAADPEEQGAIMLAEPGRMSPSCLGPSCRLPGAPLALTHIRDGVAAQCCHLHVYFSISWTDDKLLEGDVCLSHFHFHHPISVQSVFIEWIKISTSLKVRWLLGTVKQSVTTILSSKGEGEATDSSSSQPSTSFCPTNGLVLVIW